MPCTEMEWQKHTSPQHGIGRDRESIWLFLLVYCNCIYVVGMLQRKHPVHLPKPFRSARSILKQIRPTAISGKTRVTCIRIFVKWERHNTINCLKIRIFLHSLREQMSSTIENPWILTLSFPFLFSSQDGNWSFKTFGKRSGKTFSSKIFSKFS